MSSTRPAPGESRRDILRTAARLFQERGYDATSMQDIAGALNFSKAALYHHFESKEQLLFEIMKYGMDVFEERVLAAVEGIADPEQRLRACIARHVELVLSGRDREITVILHENRTLAPEAGRQINARKKHYVVYLGELIARVQQQRGLRRPSIEPHIAAMALLGMINWMYQWYRAEGESSETDIARQYTEQFFLGAFAESGAR
ncbi:MAG: TetR/AcrR family transcriptional regulator [Terriglobales bacterium]